MIYNSAVLFPEFSHFLAWDFTNFILAWVNEKHHNLRGGSRTLTSPYEKRRDAFDEKIQLYVGGYNRCGAPVA